MKKLELNKDQMERLLEMCRILYPEYKSHHLSDQMSRIYSYQNPWEFLFVLFTGEMGGTAVKIYWYEFVNTWLVEKLIATPINIIDDQPIYSRTLTDDLNKFFHNNNIYFCNKNKISVESYNVAKHPVDYLYEIFKSKRLKTN